jgi:GNAT superfamily N-acetyltransferase
VNSATPLTPRITLPPAVRADAPVIGAVFDAAVRAGWTYLGDLVAEPMFTAEDRDQLVADHRPPDLLLAAVDELDGVVGYMAVHPEDGEMFLLLVHPGYAGRGIGRALLAAAHDALRAAGCPEAFLFVHEQNEQALAVCTAAGYRPDRSDPRIRLSLHGATHTLPLLDSPLYHLRLAFHTRRRGVRTTCSYTRSTWPARSCQS